MDREVLLERLTEDVLTYVMGGSFPESHVASEIAPRELDERFHDYEALVRLHFVLRPDVVDFVEALPEHLRGLKTQTRNVSHVSRGAVRGRIDWSSTVKERYSQNPRDTSLFVCENRTENYDIDENVVLKRLLSVIYEALSECEEFLDEDYRWVNERWKGERDLVASMRRIFERNVHVTRIRRPEAYEPTERMIQRSRDSRQEIYREAARLLTKYEQTLEGEETAIRELLDQTAITPDDDETLFELFVLFRYVRAVEDLVDAEFELRTIESGSQEVASLTDGDREMVLYHDSSAPAHQLSFVSDVDDKDPAELSRTELIQHETGKVTETFFPDESSRTHTGRPDVIVLEIDHGETREYLVTEVKYSSRPETVERGVKETLEYLAFLRHDDRLVHDDAEPFGNGWNGVLVVQDVEGTETAPLDEQRSIRILQASDIDEQLRRVLEEVVEPR